MLLEILDGIEHNCARARISLVDWMPRRCEWRKCFHWWKFSSRRLQSNLICHKKASNGKSFTAINFTENLIVHVRCDYSRLKDVVVTHWIFLLNENLCLLIAFVMSCLSSNFIFMVFSRSHVYFQHNLPILSLSEAFCMQCASLADVEITIFPLRENYFKSIRHTLLYIFTSRIAFSSLFSLL